MRTGIRNNLPILMASLALAGHLNAEEASVKIKKSTPVLVVGEIEPSLELWVDRLGFTKTIEVPDGDRLGFVSLVSGDVEIMYQTRRSVDREVEDNDLPAVMKSGNHRTALFIEVDDLDELRRKVEGFEVLVSRRETPYGSTELYLREPGGHLISFASFK